MYSIKISRMGCNMNKKKYVLSKLIEKKDIYKDIIITSVIIAIGVNILTEGILKIFNLEKSNFLLIIIGIILSVVVISFHAYKDLKSINNNINFKGFIVYDKLNNEIINVPRYDVSYDICRYLNAAFAEEDILKKMWNEQPLIEIERNIENEDKINIESRNMIIEVLEFCILDRLSIELEDYFRRTDTNFENLEKIERDNIKKELLSNRFINLFTKDISQREVFSNSEAKFELQNGENELFELENLDTGEIYHKIQLIFPNGTELERNDNTLKINTKKYEIELKVKFNEDGVLIDKDFEEYYLNIHNYFDEDLEMRYYEYAFNIEVNVKLKLNTYFSKNKSEYYLWLENFIEDLENYLSLEKFMDEINWKTARTILQGYSNYRDNRLKK